MTEVEQAERAIIGCVLLQPDLAQEAKDFWFDDRRLAVLLVKIQEFEAAGKSVDIDTVSHAVPDSLLLLKEAEDQCHSPSNFPYWRDILVERYEKSRLHRAAMKFSSSLPTANGNLPHIVAELENALAQKVTKATETLGAKACASVLSHHLEEKFNLAGTRSGLETGFVDLDRILDGLQFGELTLLAARPSIGKTAIACNIISTLCLDARIPTLVISLEMSAAALCRRILSCRQQVEMSSLKSGELTESEMSSIATFHSTLAASPIFIREGFGGMTGAEAAALVRRGVRRKGIRFVVLDYLQKLAPEKRYEKRTYEVAEASAAIVNAVRDTKVAFLCLAQLNRENEKLKGRGPRMSDLADSGQIERDADTILLLHRDREKDPNSAKLIVAKQRDGETGIVSLFFDGRYCQFRNMDRGKPDQNDLPNNKPYVD